jgi:hypothetical protein
VRFCLFIWQVLARNFYLYDDSTFVLKNCHHLQMLFSEMKRTPDCLIVVGFVGSQVRAKLAAIVRQHTHLEQLISCYLHRSIQTGSSSQVTRKLIS